MIQLDNTDKYKIGKVYPCKICGVKFVMMQTSTGSVLPVELNDQTSNPPEAGTEVFDPKVHRSHLKYCKEPLLRAEQWKEIVEEMKAEFRKNKLQQIKLFSK